MKTRIIKTVSGWACSLFIIASCANQTSPTGGPKDETPPKLIHSTPANKALNYKAKIIQLTFDERIALNQPNQKILIVPTIGRNIQYFLQKKTLIIKPEEDWRDSTTYTISVRDGVKDVTESNTPKNVKISFSTGPFIDSLFITGKVQYVFKERFPENAKITVAVYRSDTFDIFDDFPYYFTETNKKGQFQIESMKAGKYYIYAFNDTNGNLKVDSKSEQYGFLSNAIPVNETPLDSLKIFIFSLDARPININSIRSNGIYTRVIANKSITEYTLDYTYDSSLIHSFGDDPTEIRIYNLKNADDSVQVKLHIKDSLDTTEDSVFYIKKQKTAKNFIPEDFTILKEKIRVYPDSMQIDIRLNLSKPLQRIDYDSAFITLDSVSKINFNEKDFEYDTTYKKLIITKKLLKNNSIEELLANKLELSLGKGFAMSVENDSSKAQKIAIKLVKKEETGTILIEVQSEKPHYEIQLISEKNEIVETVRDVKKYSFKNIPVQNYKIRIIIDDNNNGKWDPGNIVKRQEPESVVFYRNSEGKYAFPIRANWELGPLMLTF